MNLDIQVNKLETLGGLDTIMGERMFRLSRWVTNPIKASRNIVLCINIRTNFIHVYKKHIFPSLHQTYKNRGRYYITGAIVEEGNYKEDLTKQYNPSLDLEVVDVLVKGPEGHMNQAGVKQISQFISWDKLGT